MSRQLPLAPISNISGTKPSSASGKCGAGCRRKASPRPAPHRPRVRFASWRTLRLPSTTASAKGLRGRAQPATWTPSVRALESGPPPGTTDETGRTIHQSPSLGHPPYRAASCVNIRTDPRRDEEKQPSRPSRRLRPKDGPTICVACSMPIPSCSDAAGRFPRADRAVAQGRVEHRFECVRSCWRGADVGISRLRRQAYALHFAAEAPISGSSRCSSRPAPTCRRRRDHHVNVLGWATCRGAWREDVAAYCCGRGEAEHLVRHCAQPAPTTCALRPERSLDLDGALSRNELQRAPLHHAAAVNRARCPLLIDLGARVDAPTRRGRRSPSRPRGRRSQLIAMLEQAGRRSIASRP